MNSRGFVIFIIFAVTIQGAITASARLPHRHRVPKINQPALVLPMPVPIQTPAPDSDESNIFPHVLSILGNFVKVLLNREDKQQVLHGVSKIIDDVISAAHEATRKPLSSAQRTRLIKALMEKIEELTVELSHN